MGYVVRMPQLGMTMEEGIVVEWTVDPDEEFAEGDVIAVIESEKTTNDIEAREDGQLLDRFVDLDEPVEPGAPIAYVGTEDESVPDDLDVERATTTTATANTTTERATADVTAGRGTHIGGGGGDAKVSPRARAYAREQDIPEATLGELAGSGPDGAVIEQDVIENVGALTAAEAAPASGGTTGAPTASVSGRDIYDQRGDSGLRRTIAERMTTSATVPQVTLNRRADVDALLDIKDRLDADRGLTLSVTDFLLAAVVDALEEYPAFNGIYEDGVHKLARNVNLGIAVDIDEGLVTPVIHSAGDRSITELRAERQRLVSLVQAGEYTMDDLSDGTFTVTNLGHFGVESFDPLLNPPQVAILGVGDVRTRYDPEADATVEELGLSLTFDHRAVDGADAARFLDALVDALAHPLRLVSFGRDQQSTGPFLETGAGPDGDRTAAAESTGGLQATVRARRFEWRADEPKDVGGEDTAPSPVEQFVGSLSSCLTLMIGHIADEREIPLDSVNVTAQAHPPDGRIDRIDIDVNVVTDAEREAVDRVMQMAERACYVNQVIDSEIDQNLQLTVDSP